MTTFTTTVAGWLGVGLAYLLGLLQWFIFCWVGGFGVGLGMGLKGALELSSRFLERSAAIVVYPFTLVRTAYAAGRGPVDRTVSADGPIPSPYARPASFRAPAPPAAKVQTPAPPAETPQGDEEEFGGEELKPSPTS